MSSSNYRPAELHDSPGYHRYFDHLNFVHSWCQRHKEIRDRIENLPTSSESEGNLLVNRHSHWTEENASGTEMSWDEAEASEAVEMQLSAEMIEFLRISAKHKAERQAAKGELAAGETDPQWFGHQADYVNADQIGVRSRITAKSDHLGPPSDGVGKSKQLQSVQLYGEDGASMVDCLEAELQMKFDVEIDRHNSPLWPNIPLRL